MANILVYEIPKYCASKIKLIYDFTTMKWVPLGFFKTLLALMMNVCLLALEACGVALKESVLAP